MISVIIPTHNRANTIEKSVKSVLSQTYEDLELIIIDDGSTDDTENIIIQINDKRVIYHKLETNHGASNARNVGADMASGELIAYHDSDDIWHEDKLEKQMEVLKRNPDSVMVYCAYRIEGKKPQEWMRVPETFEDRRTLRGNIFRYLLLQNTVGTPTMLIKKDVFKRIGGFNTAYPALEDWDLALRISKEGTISYVDEVLVDAGRTDGGISSSVSNYFEARCRMLVENLDDIKRLGMFDDVVSDIFKRAENCNALEPVKKMVMMHLSNLNKNI